VQINILGERKESTKELWSQSPIDDIISTNFQNSTTSSML